MISFGLSGQYSSHTKAKLLRCISWPAQHTATYMKIDTLFFFAALYTRFLETGTVTLRFPWFWALRNKQFFIIIGNAFSGDQIPTITRALCSGHQTATRLAPNPNIAFYKLGRTRSTSGCSCVVACFKVERMALSCRAGPKP